MKNFLYLPLVVMLAVACTTQSPDAQKKAAEVQYEQMQHELANGWNTWDTRSVLTHVLLPCGAAIDLNLLDAAGQRAGVFRIGNRAADAPVLRPGAHTYDGAYTDLTVDWHGQKLRVQSAAEGFTNVIIVTPLEGNAPGGKLAVAPKNLWYSDSHIAVDGKAFTIEPLGSGKELKGLVAGEAVEATDGQIFAATGKRIVITCGVELSPEAAEAFVQKRYNDFVEVNRQKYGDNYEVYNAMQTVLAWNNIFDPTIRRAIAPVSRNWSVNWSMNKDMGGYILFCWDTYFASIMMSMGNRELAYANAVEVTRGVTEDGFVPNFANEGNYKSRDRSQPPVGSLAVWTIYSRYKEKWFLEVVFENLLGWNRWWDKARKVDGLLCWGSTPYQPVTFRYWECNNVNNTVGGSLESGLDNTQMYDNVPFDTVRHVQMLNDVGLSSLYVMDCKLLAKIADELGRKADARELRGRAKEYGKNLEGLWDDKNGMFFNRRTDTKAFNPRTSPTNFYPMLAEVATQAQAERMVKEHLLNPEEFGGEWMIPTTPRNDPAFADNNYWRGRIWAPLNFLVYMGLRNYDLPEARKILTEKSKKLILQGWEKDGYVFENYNAVTGVGDDVRNSDKFYHWGALLSFIALMEDGYFEEN